MAPQIYPVTLLDANQVIQYVYDEATQTLRTTASAVIIGGDVSVDIEGVYDAVTNPDPDNIGLIGHVRAVSPGDSDQTNRITSITNTNVHALDVALHTSDGSSVDTDYGTVGVDTLRTAAQIGNSTGAAAFGAGITNAQTLRVVLPTDQTAIPISDISGNNASSASITSIARSNVTGVFLAANSSRKGVIFHNDSGGVVYVAFAATASTTSFTFRMTSQETVFLNKTPIYTGIISGIWNSGGAGNMLITELT